MFTLVEHLGLEATVGKHGEPVVRVNEVRGVDRKGRPWTQTIDPQTRVILTAGAINTPTLLMKSGIGRRQDLLDVGLGEPVVELPDVGHKLQDHPAVGLVFQVNPPLVADMASIYRRFANWTEEGVLETYPSSFGYPGFSTGAFLHSGITDARTPPPAEGEEQVLVPDLQLTVFPVIIEPHVMKRRLAIDFDHVLVTVAMIDPKTHYHIELEQEGGTSEVGARGLVHDLDLSSDVSPPSTKP
mmetsp:Transcript_91100/g.260147  ORF Transcript_91100/g.260147 Transcript_91100/m.260147 type:complete len:242 (-) Transcript_91100:99-824(-)